MELMNLAWHVAALVFGVWGLWLGLESAREKALLREVVLPLLLDGPDPRSRSRFVRSVRYLVSRELPAVLKGRVKVDLGNIGGVNVMTPGWEARQLRQLFQIFRACQSLQVSEGGKTDLDTREFSLGSQDSIFLSGAGAWVGVQAAARTVVAQLRQQSTVSLLLRVQPDLKRASSDSGSGSGVYWELTEDEDKPGDRGASYDSATLSNKS